VAEVQARRAHLEPRPRRRYGSWRCHGALRFGGENAPLLRA
jgi:hypothetical protein